MALAASLSRHVQAVCPVLAVDLLQIGRVHVHSRTLWRDWNRHAVGIGGHRRRCGGVGAGVEFHSFDKGGRLSKKGSDGLTDRLLIGRRRASRRGRARRKEPVHAPRKIRCDHLHAATDVRRTLSRLSLRRLLERTDRRQIRQERHRRKWDDRQQQERDDQSCPERHLFIYPQFRFAARSRGWPFAARQPALAARDSSMAGNLKKQSNVGLRRIAREVGF